MSHDFEHLVEVPYDRATRLVFYTRYGSVKTFRVVRDDILEWLKTNVGKADFCYHRHGEYDAVKFWFSSKEKAALFKLFWY